MKARSAGASSSNITCGISSSSSSLNTKHLKNFLFFIHRSILSSPLALRFQTRLVPSSLGSSVSGKSVWGGRASVTSGDIRSSVDQTGVPCMNSLPPSCLKYLIQLTPLTLTVWTTASVKWYSLLRMLLSMLCTYSVTQVMSARKFHTCTDCEQLNG